MGEPTENVEGQPSHNIDNMGQCVSRDPIRPNELMNKGTEPKKSFLWNTGITWQSTSPLPIFTPHAVDVGALIYNDADAKCDLILEELEFTRPIYKYDNYNADWLDYLPLPEPELKRLSLSPPRTPAPDTRRASLEFKLDQDEFFTDYFPNESALDPNDSDLELPAIY